MKKPESHIKRQEALKLYLNGVGKDEISRTLHLGNRTIDFWEKKYKWKEHYDEVNRKTTEKLSQSIIEERERSLKLIKGAEAIIAQKLASGEIQGVTIQALANLQRTKWEILAPKSQTQVNVMGRDSNLKIEVNVPESVKKMFDDFQSHRKAILRSANTER